MNERFSDSEETTKSQENKVIKAKDSVWKWPCIYFLMLFICSFGLFLYKAYRITKLPEKIWNDTGGKIGSAFTPKVSVKTIIANTIGKVNVNAKMVVLTAEISVNLKKASGKTIFMDMISLGTTTVEILVPQNKIQYVVYTASLTPDCFKYDDKAELLELELPEPVLDEDIVEIQSNPDLIQVQKSIGWARLSAYSGKALEDQLKGEIRKQVIQEGKNELLSDKAFMEAQKIFEDLLSGIIKEIPGSKKIKILIRRKNDQQ